MPAGPQYPSEVAPPRVALGRTDEAGNPLYPIPLTPGGVEVLVDAAAVALALAAIKAGQSDADDLLRAIRALDAERSIVSPAARKAILWDGTINVPNDASYAYGPWLDMSRWVDFGVAIWNTGGQATANEGWQFAAEPSGRTLIGNNNNALVVVAGGGPYWRDGLPAATMSEWVTARRVRFIPLGLRYGFNCALGLATTLRLLFIAAAEGGI